MSKMFSKTKKSNPTLLLFLCVIAYAMSYLGKYGFSSNVNGFINEYHVTKAEIGLVGTCLFLAYGVGQFINGFLSKHYSSRWMVFLALIGSSICNILVLFVPFAVIKFIWMANGLFCAILYPTIMKTLGEGLPASMTKKGLIGISLSLLLGFLLCYSFSALFAYFNLLKGYFILAAIVMSVASLVWVLFLPNIENKQTEAENETKETVKHTYGFGMIMLLIIMGVMCLGSSLAKDGLTSWSPSMFVELFDAPNFLAILFSLLLPTCAAATGILVSMVVVKKPNLMLLAFICSGFALIMSILLVFFFKQSLILTIILFVLSCSFYAMITHVGSIAMPLILKDSMPSGFVAGFVNGMCYLGSGISVFLMGKIAESNGWQGVYIVIAFAALGVFLLALVTLCAQQYINKKKSI